eukprot:SAG31_NODE_11524_length_1021_cov_1.351410_3_plen_96_part_01
MATHARAAAAAAAGAIARRRDRSRARRSRDRSAVEVCPVELSKERPGCARRARRGAAAAAAAIVCLNLVSHDSGIRAERIRMRSSGARSTYDTYRY